MKRRDVVRKLRAAGYEVIREGGNHTIYGQRGKASISVPRHNELNELTARTILEAAGLR